MLKSILKTAIGGWSEMEYDASMERFGLTLYRVKDGMGGAGDREDWVIALPSGCLCVHDYQYRKPYWGLEKYRSIDAAIVGQLKSGIDGQKAKALQCDARAKDAKAALAILEKAFAKTKS